MSSGSTARRFWRTRFFVIVWMTALWLPAPDQAVVAGERQDSAQAYATEAYAIRRVDRSKFQLRYRPAIVPAPVGYRAGTIVIDTVAKQLFLIEKGGQARRYGIAVGAAGHAWSGVASVGRMAKWPAWYPTDEMHSQVSQLRRRIEPGPANPLGARALYLFKNGTDTLYRIHGTSEPWTIGKEVSSGCIRMLNEDVVDVYDRVSVGTVVVVR